MIAVLIILFFALSIGAAIRKLIGFGDAIFISPILLLFLDQLSIVTPLIGLTTLFLGVIIIIYDGSAFKLSKSVIIFLLIALIGIVTGYQILNNEFRLFLKIGLSIFTIAICTINLYQRSTLISSNKYIKSLLAFLSGFFSILYNMPGITTSLYFSDLKKREFRSSINIIFIILEPISTLGHYHKGLLDERILSLFILIGIPACLFGVLLTELFSKYLEISTKKFERRINQFLITVSIIIIISVLIESLNLKIFIVNLEPIVKNIYDYSLYTYLIITSIILVLGYILIKLNKNHP